MKPVEKNHKQEVDRLVRIITDCYNIIPLTPGNSLAFGDCLLTPHIEKLVNAYDNVVKENARLVEERDNPTNPHTQLALENEVLRNELAKLRWMLSSTQNELEILKPYRICLDHDDLLTVRMHISKREAQHYYAGTRAFLTMALTRMIDDAHRSLTL